MTRSARRRHALLWLVLGPAILIALVVSIKSRPPAAVSDGPVLIVSDRDSAKPQTAASSDNGGTP